MKIIFTTVIRAAQLGEVHGGLLVVDYPSKEILFESTCDEDFSGENERGGERGLRGIAVADNRIYVAGSRSIQILDADKFDTLTTKHYDELDSIHEICYHNDHLWITSTGNDCIAKLDQHLNVADVWHITGKQHENHHTVSDKTKVGTSVCLPPPLSCREGEFHEDLCLPLYKDSLHINSISAHNNRVVFSGCLTPLYDFDTLEEVKGLVMGGFTHNFEEFPDMVLSNKTSSKHLEVITPYDRIFYPVPSFKGKIKRVSDEIAKPNWHRGMVRHENLVFIGSSPARILVFDLEKRSFIDELNFSDDPRHCIHGIELLGV